MTEYEIIEGLLGILAEDYKTHWTSITTPDVVVEGARYLMEHSEKKKSDSPCLNTIEDLISYLQEVREKEGNIKVVLYSEHYEIFQHLDKEDFLVLKLDEARGIGIKHLGLGKDFFLMLRTR